MRIAEAARALGVGPAWIRHMERAGALPRAARDRNGQRRYTEADVEAMRQLLMRRDAAPTAEEEETA